MSFLAPFVPAITVTLILLVAERLAALAGDRTPTDWWINLQTWLVKIGMLMLLGGAVTAWHGPALIDAGALPVWLAALLYVLVFDLGEYLYHRMQHAIPMLWAIHSLHHSDPEMAVLTTNRHYWADSLFKTVTVWSAAALVISPTPTAVAVYAGLNLWSFFTHARLRVDFGRWSWLINSPAYHRRHHSCLPEHYNSNFAAILPIWDVIAGSYHRPDGWPPTGLDARPRTMRDLLFWPLYHDRGEAGETAADHGKLTAPDA